MMESEPKRTTRLSAAARAEAAAWVARLHGPSRTPEVEAGLRRWLADDPEHEAAFEHLTDTWEKSARLRRRPMEQIAGLERTGLNLTLPRAALATLVVASLAIAGTVLYLRTDAITTAVGEQRAVTLDDGTRLTLNTDSRAVVQYDRTQRRVKLERGEALFEVAKRPDWPFIVSAGDREVRALGTAFIVRRDDQTLSVILVEGKVTVTPTNTPGLSAQLDGAMTRTPPGASAAPSNGLTLSAGERLRLGRREPAKIDRPSMERVTAWQRGQVALDSTSLADAVAEMNRYSRALLVIENPEVAAIPVSGLFKAGDSENFAKAVAKSYRLEVREDAGRIILAGTAELPPR